VRAALLSARVELSCSPLGRAAPQELLQKDLRLLGIQSESERAVRQLRQKRNNSISFATSSGTARRGESGYTSAAKTESTLSDPDSLELQASLPDPFAGLGA